MSFVFKPEETSEDDNIVDLFRNASPPTRSMFLRILALDPARRELCAVLSELNNILGD
jgi:hypothetical protein